MTTTWKGIADTINQEVLKGCATTFKSTRIDRRSDGGLGVECELEPPARVLRIAFDLTIRAGRLIGERPWSRRPGSGMETPIRRCSEP